MEKTLKISLAENLNRLISDRNWTINSTAKKIGMSKSTLHNYCCGFFPKNLEDLAGLADLFGISLNELILGEKQTEGHVVQRFLFDGVYEISVRKKINCLPGNTLPQGSNLE